MSVRDHVTKWAHPLVLLCAAAVLSPATAQDEQYRERQVLDPNSDEWIDEAPPEPATPGGELEAGRSALARGESKSARRRLKKWVKRNPEHERYFEGVFLLGEAYFERKNFYRAFEQYELVVENAAGELFQKALLREIEVARAFLSGQKRIVWRIFRFPAYEEGIDILDRVWERAPGTRLGEVARRLKADYFVARGDFFEAQDEYVGLAREYPNGRYVRLAMLRAAESAGSAFPGILFDDRPLVDAEVRYQQLQSAYPEYARAEAVGVRLEGIRQQRADKDLEIAKWYERTRQSGAAEFYYRLVLRDWPDSLAANEARGRMRALGIELNNEEGRG